MQMKSKQSCSESLHSIHQELSQNGPTPRALALILKGMHDEAPICELQSALENELWWLLQELPCRPEALHPELRTALLDYLTQTLPHINKDLQSIQAWSLGLLECLSSWDDFVSLQTSITLPTQVPPLLLHPLSQCFLQDTVLARAIWEQTLCQLRALALQEHAYLSTEWENTLLLLAQQAWNNQYIWYISPEEEQQLEILFALESLSQTQLALVTTYIPLGKLSLPAAELTELEVRSPQWSKLIETSVKAPEQELQMAQQIQSLSPSLIEQQARGGSDSVRSFYEAFPYPQWQGQPLAQALSLRQHLSLLFPQQAWDQYLNQQMRVLIAGCGTGQQLMLHTSQNPQAQLTGIDLSKNSLAYAQRQFQKLGLAAELFQADILDLPTGALQPFDLIETVGVLHHLKEPLQGLKSLTGLLKPGGLIKLGVYSQIARQPILHLRQSLKISEQLTQPELRHLRQAILDSPNPALDGLKKLGEFYQLNHCMDLLCHPQEQNFTLPELQDWFQALGLKVLGLELWNPSAYQIYAQIFPEDKQATNLQNWWQLEQEEPTLFWPMYIVWLTALK